MDISGKTGSAFSNILDKAEWQGRAYGEFNFYSTIDASSGKAKETIALESSEFKVIEGLCILPEFVGGNENISYIMQETDSLITSITIFLTRQEHQISQLQEILGLSHQRLI